MLELARVGETLAPVLADWGAKPHVLVFTREWDGEADLAQIRAHLRGLGAGLVIVAADDLVPRIFTLGADDDLMEEPPPANLGEIASRYGLRPGDEAVFVLDQSGRVCFAHQQDESVARALPAALAAAQDAIHAPAPRVMFSRREWAITSLVAGFAFAFLGGSGCKTKEKQPEKSPAPPPGTAQTAAEEIDVVLNVNGADRKLRIEPRVSLLDALRERLALPGTKKGCDAGQCGACTVLADGKRIVSCLTLACMAQGQKLVTIEGLATGDQLHPMQQAFVEHDALQCGYCTPGQILSAVALVAENRAHTDAEVREHMSGNICRCGAYPNIVAAIQAARTQKGA